MLAFGLTLLYACIFYALFRLWRHWKDGKWLAIVEETEADCARALDSYNALFRHDRGYLEYNAFQSWLRSNSDLHKRVQFMPDKLASEAISTIKNVYGKGDVLRQRYNETFISYEMGAWSDLFDSVEGRSLDAQQRRAVIINDRRQLVVAGAGSGKTTTIVGKAEYLVQRYQIDPKDILVISFTKKAVNSLEARIAVDGISAKTFHRLGLDIITAVEGRKSSIFAQEKFASLIKQEFLKKLEDESYLSLVTEFFISYLKEPKTEFEFENHGQYIEYVKSQNFKTYKSLNDGKSLGIETIQMERVKSMQECQIANYLFMNGVEYEYEAPYPITTSSDQYAQYKPDFTITQGNKTVYLEHYGMDREGNVPTWFASEGESYTAAQEKYQAKYDWARETHDKHETTLIESFSYEMDEGSLFQGLKSSLKQVGIQLNAVSPEVLWTLVKKTSKHDVENFVLLVSTFVQLMKSKGTSFPELREVTSKMNNNWQRTRTHTFLDICEPVAKSYADALNHEDSIDFSDMIVKAEQYVKSIDFQNKWKYIIVDEFQDVSFAQYRLLKTLVDQTPECKLMCVGDDWQSIYRFRGSDTSIFTDFELYFGRTEKSFIETTYRFGEPLLTLSSDFISKNPLQLKKDLKNGLGASTAFSYMPAANADLESVGGVQSVLSELALLPEIDKKSILFLGRYNSDIRALTGIPGVSVNSNEVRLHFNLDYSDRKMAQFMTVHSAKGLEADIVILLNGNSGKYGFPSEIADDPILDLVLNAKEHYDNAEERRLFYVAMTRARERFYLISDSGRPSKFVYEITDVRTKKNPRCPKCRMGEVLHRGRYTAKNGTPYDFYGCSNFSYGCGYKKTVWLKETSKSR